MDKRYVDRLAWLMAHGPRGVTRQVDICTRTGLTKAEVSRLCSGQTDPKLSTLEKVARALGVGVADLVPHSVRDRLDVVYVDPETAVVIDNQGRLPAEGEWVAIRHPEDRTLRVMQAHREGEHWRFTDSRGYVIGNEDLVVGSAVLTINSSLRTPPRRERASETTLA